MANEPQYICFKRLFYATSQGAWILFPARPTPTPRADDSAALSRAQYFSRRPQWPRLPRELGVEAAPGRQPHRGGGSGRVRLNLHTQAPAARRQTMTGERANGRARSSSPASGPRVRRRARCPAPLSYLGRDSRAAGAGCAPPSFPAVRPAGWPPNSSSGGSNLSIAQLAEFASKRARALGCAK